MKVHVCSKIKMYTAEDIRDARLAELKEIIKLSKLKNLTIIRLRKTLEERLKGADL